MNFSSAFGVLFGIGILLAALRATTPNLEYFLDLHGILIVVGGTAAAASISFPLKELFYLVRVFLSRVLGRHKTNHQEVITQLLELNKKTTMGLSVLKESLPGVKDEFLREGVALVATGVLTESEIRMSLEQRIKTIEARLMHEANMFRTIGRFPPAFGLLATTLGMIGLLQKLGSPDSQKLIGPAMSVGLIGTLYGIALANLVFIPIAENLHSRTQEEIALRRMIVEGIIMLKSQVNPITMRESLNSFVLPQYRITKKAA